MAKKSGRAEPIAARLMGLFASLFFSVPTAVMIWLAANKELAYWSGGFISSNYLVALVVVFAIIALLLPQLFPSVLGVIWRGLLKLGRWWG